MERETASFLSRKYFGILLVLYSSIHQIVSLKSVNTENCFGTTNNGAPVCDFQISEDTETVSAKCLKPGVLQITGDYKVFHINCNQTYPLDFKFDGHKPTEAIHARAWGQVETNSGGKFTHFYLSVKIMSISSLDDHYRNLFPDKVFHSRDAYGYSRTGNYIVSGYHGREKLESQFYIFFEETNSKHSFIRNDEVKLRLPILNSTVLGENNLVVPCRPSHFNDRVSLKQTDNNGTTTKINFTYDATAGFVSTVFGIEPHLNLTNLQFSCHFNGTAETAVDFIQFSIPKTDVAFGFDGLPEHSGVTLSYIVARLANGSVITQPLCEFGEKDNNNDISTIASLGIGNPMMYRLLRDFVLPAFSNQSYSVTTTTKGLVAGERLIQENTYFLIVNSYCGDKTHYLADTLGVGVTGNFLSFKYVRDFVKETKENYPIENYITISRDGRTPDNPDNELYMNAEVTFRCYLISFYYIPPIIWYTERRNGSVIEEEIDYDWKDNFFSYASIKLSGDVQKLICAAPLWNTGVWRNISLNVTLKAPTAPSFSANQSQTQRFPVNSVNKIIKCTATGAPQPTIYWQKNGKNISSSRDREGHGALLEFTKVKKEDEGIYICVASNFAHRREKMFNVEVFTDTNNGLTIGVPILVLICFVVAISAWIYVRYFRNETSGLTKSELHDFFNGEGENSGQGNSSIQLKMVSKSNEYVHEFTHLCPYNKEYEMAADRFQIDTTNVLGSGAYGMVVTGKLDGVPIAVKTVKKNADKSYLKALLCELKVMIFLGSHENLVGILGASTTNLSKGQVYIFVPLCELGSLENYLKNNRHLFINEPEKNLSGAETEITSMVTVDGSSNSGNLSFITMKHLYDWSLQIAQGMDYLSTKRVIHGDLAARNILLTNDRAAKITDFGLSRKLYNYAEYAKRQQEPLPWRYMALESLRDLKFSTKSDVWSYGVTLWEIFSLARVPYPGYSWTLEFIAELESGLRLERPYLATDLYEALMKDCWHSDPQLRPSFSFIQEQLKEIYKF